MQQAKNADILVLARLELSFLIIACMALCFGFVMKSVLKTQWYSNYCQADLEQRPDIFCFSLLPTSEQARRAQGIGRWQLGWLTPTDLRDILYHTSKKCSLRRNFSENALSLHALDVMWAIFIKCLADFIHP